MGAHLESGQFAEDRQRLDVPDTACFPACSSATDPDDPGGITTRSVGNKFRQQRVGTSVAKDLRHRLGTFANPKVSQNASAEGAMSLNLDLFSK